MRIPACSSPRLLSAAASEAALAGAKPSLKALAVSVSMPRFFR
jgi:hypothetical protein